MDFFLCRIGLLFLRCEGNRMYGEVVAGTISLYQVEKGYYWAVQKGR